MKIGIDLLPLQSPGSRLRGVGRYGRELVSSLLNRGDGHEYILYAYEDYPRDHLPDGAETRFLKVGPSAGQFPSTDVLLVLNAFELVPGYDPPRKRRGGPRLAAVVYDFIPFLEQERYLDDPGNAHWFYRRLQTIAHYDHLLAISDATRDDAIRLLGVDPSRVANISGASDSRFFAPDRSFPMPLATRRTLARFGISRPFVLSVAGADERKNVRGLIEAFARLPLEIAAKHQLAITCHLKTEDRIRLQRIADDLGLGTALVLTGEVTDEELRTLYQRCAAFAFPSLYEGLGLPLLEAMHCGAPVLAGRNSSQVEVVGDTGLLVNASEPSEIAAGLARLLADPRLAAELGAQGRRRGATFTWDGTATKLVAALDRMPAPRSNLRTHRAHPQRPRIAVVSPWKPKKSGISTYAERLVEGLSSEYRVELFHDSGYVPDAGLGPGGLPCFDHRLLDRLAAHRDYRAILYQMGNSPYHGFLYDLMRSHPGIVTLHDFSLGGFQYWRASQADDPDAAFRDEVQLSDPTRAAEIMAHLPAWRDEPGGVQDALTRRGIHLNRRVLEAATRLVVHSPWCLDRCAEIDPDLAKKVRVIPHGAQPSEPSPGNRQAVRDRFRLAQDAILFGSFGFLSRGKMNLESLRAFAAVSLEFPTAQFLFAGQDCERGEAKDEAQALGLFDRVRFLGRCDESDFRDLLQAVDVGISLRRPPTYGETSGALLDLLRHGVATIVSDVGTFADYPDDVTIKVDGQDSLVLAMRRLAADAQERAALGRRALASIAEKHAWPLVWAEYARLIEEAAANRIPAPRPLVRSIPAHRPGAVA